MAKRGSKQKAASEHPSTKSQTKRQTKTEERTIPVIWTPLDTLDRMNRSFLDNTGISPWLRGMMRQPGQWLGSDMREIPLDLMDKGAEYQVVAEMPGIDKKDIEISLTPRELRLCGRTELEEDTRREEYIRRERSYTMLCRTLSFPEEVNPDKAQASMQDGILQITVKKKKTSKVHERKLAID